MGKKVDAMEKKLKKLLDYQTFEKNERLEQLIRKSESRYAKELSDADLSLVNAAGELATTPTTPDKNSAANGGGIYRGGSGGGGAGAGGNGAAM